MDVGGVPVSGIVSLTRRITFAAAHRYRRPEWDDARNLEVFGVCAHPAFHGHTYVCDVTVSGPVDATTGMIVDLRVIDEALQARVMGEFDHKNLNVDIPEFAEGGGEIPTCENVARLVARRVQDALGTKAAVTEVVVAESPNLWATWRAR
jgi:6-pyruvoyltetrahydropterin/6-carboxytetrahydropterin synthase